MKRVCTLRKVLPLGFKGPLRKVIFYRSYISWLLSPLSSYRLWNISSREICYGIATLNICIRKSFSDFIATFATHILTYWYTAA